MANDLKGISILFFCPKYFGYELEIKRGLENMGAAVTSFDERPSNSFLSKVIIRTDRRFLTFKIKDYYQSILNRLIKSKKHFDYVLFVNPESVTREILLVYRKQFASARFIMYMWDSFNNKKNHIDLLPLFDAKFTFDSNDAKKYDLTLRPLFYINLYNAQKRKDIFDLLFVGTAHSDRYIFVQKIKSLLPNNLKFKTFFYLDGKLLYFGKRMAEKSFRLVPYYEITFKSLSHKENAALVHQSKAILDINHPRQTGLTMRTFETLGAQKKLITTNASILNYDFYDKNNVLIIDRENPIIENSFLEGNITPTSKEILFKYSIEGWIHTLFNLAH